MRALDAFLYAYRGGLGCLVVLAAQALVDDLPRRRYAGRHRASGRMSWPERIATRAATEVSRIHRAAFVGLMTDQPKRVVVRADVLREETASLFLPDVDESARVEPAYQHSLGVGRYAHLRPEELDATVERDLRRLKPRAEVDLTALRLRATVPVAPELDDEWVAA